MAKVLNIAVSLAVISALGVGCSTLNKSTATGAGTGAAFGGIAGSLIPGDSSDKPKNIFVGAIAGATIGALSGALIHKNMEDKEREAFDKGKKASQSSSSRGSVVSSSNGSSHRHFSPPKIERRWMEMRSVEIF